MPFWVNLTALPSRLRSTWRSLPSSPSWASGTSSATLTSRARPFSEERTPIISDRPRIMSRTRKGPALKVSLPASILAMERTSLMRPRRCSPALRIRPRLFWMAGLAPGSRRVSWAKPRMAFRGVRSSWLMLARKVLLARLASCAFCSDRSSWEVRSLRSWVRSSMRACSASSRRRRWRTRSLWRLSRAPRPARTQRAVNHPVW